MHGLTAEDPFPWLDQSGLAALQAGSFVVLVKFFTSYSHVDFPAHASTAVHQQIGIPLFLAALAALVGEVKLASNAHAHLPAPSDEQSTNYSGGGSGAA